MTLFQELALVSRAMLQHTSSCNGACSRYPAAQGARAFLERSNYAKAYGAGAPAPERNPKPKHSTKPAAQGARAFLERSNYAKAFGAGALA